jgi:hypothetical protein
MSKPWTLKEFGGKTVWDWMDLLIVPIMLSLITVAFTWQQNTSQQRIEGQRAETERYIEDQRAQDEALQAYFDQMSSLLLLEDLRESPVGSEVRTLARARTLQVLGRLDPYRKRSVLLFLNDSRLINRQDMSGAAGEHKDPVVSLEAADLRGAKLSGSNVIGSVPSGVPMDESLPGASTSLSQTPSQTPVDASQMGSGDITVPGADLSGTNLSGTDLRGTSLLNADLTRADLSDAVLKNTDLTGADLSYAVLTGAEGVSAEELQRLAGSLQGTIMPDGELWSAPPAAPSSAPEVKPEGEVTSRHPASKPFPEPAREAPPPPSPD